MHAKLIPNLAEIDRKAVQIHGIRAETLMENAGHQVALAVMGRMPARTGRITVVCGPGNNGGDGFVCARLLHHAGYTQTRVIFTGREYRGETLANLERLMLMPVEVIQAREQSDLAVQRIEQADILVDALFGSGLTRPVDGLEAALVEAINANRQAAVVAVDIPSGVDGATGAILGTAVTADETVTFAAAKPGLFLYPGKARAGRVQVVDIGIPPDLLADDASPIRLITPETAVRWLPPRPTDGHKYTFGHVLVVAGSRGMPGAAVLCAEAAMRSGAGLVTLAAPESVFHHISLMPELIRLPLPESPDGRLTREADGMLEAFLEQKPVHAVALGPGLTHHPDTAAWVHHWLSRLTEQGMPLVVDADGLNALSDWNPSQPLGQSVILTPHLGECARLLGRSGAELAQDLIQAAQATLDRWQATVILKTASPVIAGPDGFVWISPVGNSGMATAGSGDVLTGLVAGLVTQAVRFGQPVHTAAPLGVYLHGLAGDAARSALTEYAMTAGDITAHFGTAFSRLLEARNS